MKKIILVCSICFAGMCLSLKVSAQADELAELALDIEKLAQFKQILSDLKKGYEILFGGYNTIKNISKGNFELHKRTAVQENNVQPVYGQSSFIVTGNGDHEFIYGFGPFTIPSNQEFIIQVTEKSGGRALLLRISHRVILKARILEN